MTMNPIINKSLVLFPSFLLKLVYNNPYLIKISGNPDKENKL